MIALKIEDLKHFTGQLFAGEAFDHWQVRDVSIVTFNTFTIDRADSSRILLGGGAQGAKDQVILALEQSAPVLLFVDSREAFAGEFSDHTSACAGSDGRFLKEFRNWIYRRSDRKSLLKHPL